MITNADKILEMTTAAIRRRTEEKNDEVKNWFASGELEKIIKMHAEEGYTWFWYFFPCNWVGEQVQYARSILIKAGYKIEVRANGKTRISWGEE